MAISLVEANARSTVCSERLHSAEDCHACGRLSTYLCGCQRKAEMSPCRPLARQEGIGLARSVVDDPLPSAMTTMEADLRRLGYM